MIDTAHTLSRTTVLFGVFGFTTLLIAGEYLYARLAAHDEEIAARHDLRETAASVGVAVGDLLIRILMGGLVALPLMAAYEHRVLDLDLTRPWTVVALILGVELCYYWYHRASHRIRWMWATHAVHHSATHFNLSAAVRLGWTGPLTFAYLFFLPLAVLGFHPVAIAGVMLVGLLYQFFLHTSLDIDLGPLEYVLNTPRHHRVHHASNDACLDRNYGSMLIIYDRLFGTFAEAPRGERLRFGLKGRAPSFNPLQIALGEWVHLYRDVRATPGLWGKLKVLLGAP